MITWIPESKGSCDVQPNQPANSNVDHVYCPFPRRLLAMFYDAVILLGLLILGSALALPFGDINKVAFQDFWFTLWLSAVCFAYLGGCWRHGGMTVGMRAWRIKLVSGNERSISWPRCLLRFLVGLVSIFVFGAGIVWALIDSKNRGWHDLAAQTLLVKQNAAKK